MSNSGAAGLALILVGLLGLSQIWLGSALERLGL